MQLPPISLTALALLLAGNALAQDPACDASTSGPVVRDPRTSTSQPDVPFGLPEGFLVHPTEDPEPAATRPVQDKPAGPQPTFARILSSRDLLTEPQWNEPGDGLLWARTRDLRVRFDADGMTVLPIFGRRSPQEWPLDLQLVSASVAGEPLDVTPLSLPGREGSSVRLDRADLDEVHHLTLDGVEQTFVLDELATRGELVLRVAVDTELAPLVDGELLRFQHAELGHVDYGTALAYDSRGARTPVSRTFEDGAIVLRVPAAFVQGAALPLTVDPLVTTFIQASGAADDSRPDMVWAGGPQRYFLSWEEYTSATNADVYITSFNAAGVQGATFGVEFTNDHWATPRLAYVPALDRILVVASRTTDGPGTGLGSIRGQLVDSANSTLVGSPIVISTEGVMKYEPDVAGTNYVSTTNNHFLVTWSRVQSITQRDIEIRAVDWDGTFVTPVTSIASEIGVDMRQPALSDSHGNSALAGDFWTLAWIRDDDQDGRGQVWARRVVWSGTTGLTNGNFLVNAAQDCANPCVTSRLDTTLSGTSDRPSIVAYDRRFLVFFPTLGTQRSVFANVVIDGQAFQAVDVNTKLEDFDGTLDQFGPGIASDGTGFLLAYSEEFYGNIGGSDDDVYVVTGHIAFDAGGPSVALAERHENLAFSIVPEHQVHVCALRDGDNQLSSDDGAVVWLRETGTDNGLLACATVDIDTTDGSPQITAGVQYCDAVPNSVGTQGDRNSSWLTVLGNRSVGSGHLARAEDLPVNQFGYLLCSLTPTAGVIPGGAVGRLCLGGSIGRFVNQIDFSGTAGTFSTVVDPSALPLGSGPVAAQPGQTWCFQYWHRDVEAGLPTSNFTNGCAVTFVP